MNKYILLFAFLWTSSVFAGNFTSGNLVVVRVGDGSAALSSAATAVFLDEYTPSGTLVQSIALPTAVSGSNHAFTLSGSATSEGSLALSPNRQFLTLAGYDAAPGLTKVSTDSTTNRTIALIGTNGTPNTATGFVVGSAYVKNNIRSAVTNDGSEFWTAGTGSGTSGGVWYLPSGSFTSSPVQISTTVTNARVINIFGSQLYTSTSSGSYHGVNSVGTGLPTTSGQTITNLPGMAGADTASSSYGFYFFDENPNIPGVDVLYICDDHTVSPAGGLYKYSLVGGTWVSNGNITDATGLRGITATQSCTGIQLYLSDVNSLYSFQDNSGYNGALTGSFTTIASAGSNTVFHGVAFAPGTATTGGVQATIANSTNVSCPGGSNGAITLTVSGGSNYTYAWSDGNVTTQNRNNLPAGIYTVTATSNGCSATATDTITQPSAFNISSSIKNVSCNGGSNGAITLNVTGGSSPYSFSPSTLSGLTAGNYTVTVTDANSCSTTTTGQVTQPNPIVITDTLTNLPCSGGGNTGAINIGVTGGNAGGGYTYAWSNSSTTKNIANLAAGPYSVVVTDTAGCSASLSATLSHAGNLTVNPIVANVTCFGLSNGSITLTPAGGTAPYNFNWYNNDTAHQLTGLANGSYDVTITDQGGCTLVTSVAVSQPTLLTATTSVTNVTCYGSANGSYTITPNGGTSPYTFSPGTGAGQNLAPGIYTVTVIDNNGCNAVVNDTITQPDSISLALTVTNASAFGANDGLIVLSASGGTGNYSYNWSDGISTANDSNLVADTYCVTVTDQNQCADSACATVTQPTGIAGNSWMQKLTTYTSGGNLIIDVTLANEMRCSVELYDITGNLINTSQPENTPHFNMQWPMAPLASGCYMIRVITSEGFISKKVIIIK
jgi:SprB repeat